MGDSGTNINFTVVDAATEERSPVYSINDWDPPQEIELDGGKGWSRAGVISVPASIVEPAAVLVQKIDTNPLDGASVDYITQVDLTSPQSGLSKFPVHSWVSSNHGERGFYAGTFLPKDTPPHLQDEREAELKALRGDGGPASELRTYNYMTYNDLGPARPTLGGNTTLPYPRRTATKAPGKENLPYDEQFTFAKQTGFKGDGLAAIATAFTQKEAAAAGVEPSWFNVLPLAAVGLAKMKLGVTTKPPEFKRFEDVKTLYKPTDNVLADADAETLNQVTAQKQVGPLKAAAKGKTFEQQQKEAAQGKIPEGSIKDYFKRAVGQLLKQSEGNVLDINELLAYRLPKIEAGRPGMWATDLEFGRQVLAGMNPCVFEVLKELPAARGSAIGPQHVDDDLKKLDPQGRTMAQLVAAAAAGEKPQLFIIDYWILNVFWGETQGRKDRCEHVGRVVLYLQKKDGRDVGMVPIAIELAHRGNINGNGGVVYSRAALMADKKQQVLWGLAKAAFKSVDSGWHQLVSHWLRCHACTEPFLIALRRNISIMHPVAKLMIPHFRYTLNINSNARESLINENGTIETAFTPGAYAIRLSSAAYSLWRFKNQALPTELKSRGVLSSDGKLLLDDYPYAQDGLDVWNAYMDYFGAYLKLYYKSDADVLGDTELQAWWNEVKDVAHGDIGAVVRAKSNGKSPAAVKAAAEEEIWGFAGPIPSVEKLTWVLTTIAWIASGHHAAVNFGQYDISGLMLNVSPTIRRPVPNPGDVGNPAYKALVDKSGDAQEGELLTYVADFTSAVQVMTTVQLLSSHADDEQTLDEPNTMITDPEAVLLNQSFMNRMTALEMTFLNRNRDPRNWTRVRGKAEALEYTLLYPSSKPGVTMRGVPYSVSI